MEGRMIMQKHEAMFGGQTPGIVHGVRQQLADVYPANTALRRGTLYPELDKPMACAPVPTGCAEATAKQAASFAAWELRLYLNTHPTDTGALHFFEQLCQQNLKPSYACAFAPCQSTSAWRWVEDPWPWELCANEGRA